MTAIHAGCGASLGMNIGIDIVRISRVEKLLSGSTDAIFTAKEMEGDVQTIAGRFAAKEAYFKAIGVKRDWLSIQILQHENGAPHIVSPEGDRVRVSISHDGEYAAAVVLITET